MKVSSVVVVACFILYLHAFLGEGVDYDYDMISNSITQTDPPDLWVSTPDDPLPDIITLDSLLEYCGESRAGMTISLYMVTREMIESGLGVRPLATYEPHLYCKYSSFKFVI